MIPMKGFREILPTEYQAVPLQAFVRSGKLGVRVSELHWHAETEIVISRCGTGMQQIGNSLFTLSPGYMSVVSSFQPHSFLAVSDQESFDLLVIQFRAEHFLTPVSGDRKFCDDWLSGRLLFSHPIPVSGLLSDVTDLIWKNCKKTVPGSACALEGLVRMLLYLLYQQPFTRLTASSAPAITNRYRAAIDPAIMYLAKYYSKKDLSLEEAAAATSLSTTHFCRLFRAAVGMGFHEYLNQYRIAQAEQLFHTSLSLEEIAFRCGFGSGSAFLRNYKKYRHMSPRQARKQY